MAQSLLFIPDISGFTKFVQNTEVAHSKHVIAELLEVLISANTLELQLAEIEGDALFFYKEDLPSQEKLLAQIEGMFTAFYSHLKLLEKNRICPCNACATAPELELKIVAHAGLLQFLNVGNAHKPFGSAVIEAHRLLKNKVDSDNYTLLSSNLTKEIGLKPGYCSKTFCFQSGSDSYDGVTLPYEYAIIEKNTLSLLPFQTPKLISFFRKANFTMEKQFKVSANTLLELITNYTFRHDWIDGVDKFEFPENEITRLGSEHTCVINGKHFDFITVTKTGKPLQVVYGELTTNVPGMEAFYQFYSISPINAESCMLTYEIFWELPLFPKNLLFYAFVKRNILKNSKSAIENLYYFAEGYKDM